MVDIPIVAVHSADNYSWDLCLKVMRQDAILFYSTEPIRNEQAVKPENFKSAFYVRPGRALDLYNELRSSSPRPIISYLGLENRDPREVFEEFVEKKERELMERQTRIPFQLHLSELDLRLQEMHRNYSRGNQTYLQGRLELLTASELNDYEMVRARRSEERNAYWDNG